MGGLAWPIWPFMARPRIWSRPNLVSSRIGHDCCWPRLNSWVIDVAPSAISIASRAIDGIEVEIKTNEDLTQVRVGLAVRSLHGLALEFDLLVSHALKGLMHHSLGISTIITGLDTSLGEPLLDGKGGPNIHGGGEELLRPVHLGMMSRT